MQNRQYKDLFRLITSMIGTGGELPGSGTEDTQLADFINRRFFEAYQTSSVWPRYVVTGEERDIAVYNISNVTGSAADKVNGNFKLVGQIDSTSLVGKEDTNIYAKIDTYQNTTADNLFTGSFIYKLDSGVWKISNDSTEIIILDSGKIRIDSEGTTRYTSVSTTADNIEDVKVWTAGTDVSGTPRIKAVQMIPYVQFGKTNIGDVNRIHRKKPFFNNSAIEYDFYADVDGAHILNITNTTDSTAFVTYKIPFAAFTVTTDFYNSEVDVPEEFFNFIAHTAYADFLRVQNKQEEAIAEENVGAKYLAQELEKVDIRMNNSTINKRFSTYVNRQSR